MLYDQLLSGATGGALCVTVFKTDKPSTYIVHSIDEVKRLVTGTVDAHVAPSRFIQGWHEVNGKQRFRTQENVFCTKAFWLDIDVGDGANKYPTLEVAIQELTNFVATTGLPLPTIVLSGVGMHCYWVLECVLLADEWKPYALALKTLCATHGLKSDNARTAEIATTLRAVGSVNPKSGRVVEVLHDAGMFKNEIILDVLGTVVIPNNTHTLCQPLPTELSNAFGDAFGGVIEKPKSNDGILILERCKQIQSSSHGSEPVWYGMMSVMNTCHNGAVVAEAISRLDIARFNQEEFQDKWSYIESDSNGPMLCSTFDCNATGICDGCVYKGSISSPAQLGKEVQPTTVPVVEGAVSSPTSTGEATDTFSIIPLRSPAFRVRDGEGVYWMVYDKDGEITGEVKILDCAMYPLSAQRTRKSFMSDEKVYIWYTTKYGSDPRQIRMVAGDLASETSFRTWCFNNGVMCLGGSQGDKKGYEYMKHYLAQVQNALPCVDVKDHFGWMKRDVYGKASNGFIIGDMLYTTGLPPTKVGLPESLESFADRAFSNIGTLDAWKAVPNFYSRNNIMWGQLGMCLAFAAPLMEFAPTESRNAIFNFWSDASGTGKTTLQRAVNSVWGNPDRLLLNVQSTANSRYRSMGWLHSLPVCINEVTKFDEQELSNMIFQISEGQEKDRMAQHGGLQYSGTWNTLTIMSANYAVIDRMATVATYRNAELKRVIDIKTSKSANVSREDALRMGRALMDNQGVAGVAFLNHLLATHSRIDDVSNKISEWTITHTLDQDERYWATALATAVMAGRLAVEAGILDYDMDALEAYCIRVLNDLRVAVGTVCEPNKDMLGDFLADHVRSMLVVREEARSEKTAQMPDGLDGYVIRSPISELDVRVEVDTGTIYIRKAAIKNWCTQTGIVQRRFVESLGVCEEVNTRMGRGVRSLPQTPARSVKIVNKDLVEQFNQPEEANSGN